MKKTKNESFLEYMDALDIVSENPIEFAQIWEVWKCLRKMGYGNDDFIDLNDFKKACEESHCDVNEMNISNFEYSFSVHIIDHNLYNTWIKLQVDMGYNVCDMIDRKDFKKCCGRKKIDENVFESTFSVKIGEERKSRKELECEF